VNSSSVLKIGKEPPVEAQSANANWLNWKDCKNNVKALFVVNHLKYKIIRDFLT
jgi:hypothetical protein